MSVLVLSLLLVNVPLRLGSHWSPFRLFGILSDLLIPWSLLLSSTVSFHKLKISGFPLVYARLYVAVLQRIFFSLKSSVILLELSPHVCLLYTSPSPRDS
eukprot:TRINITY_DN3631_c0_g2_i2.p2 TRINITY_DN3631_c0_g2~~TRINITY_DN3631_c0_g2_i2.p2  ORF type:complete len:100 (+),score=5.28 TRINITY_DN3631_c0_g2_i2:847-1146(+)